MFSKILMAVDSSHSSEAVISCAKPLYELGARECVLAQCYLIQEHIAFPDQVKSHIESILEQQKEKLEKQGIRTTIKAELGLAGKQIPRIAAENDCSVIIIGSHGHSLASEIFLGSSAAEIIHQSRLPVLVIRVKEDKNTGETVCIRKTKDIKKHILYATDFSEHSRQAFEYVVKFAEAGASKITLMHIQEKARISPHLEDKLEEFNSIDKKRLDLLKKRLNAVSDIPIEIEIKYGSAANEIIEKTKSSDVGTVVMGSHGRGFISELFAGSVSYNVARHCEASVLLVPKS